MAGLSLRAIREAFADSLRERVEGFNVSAYPGDGRSTPRISIFASGSDYVDYWLSFGSAGLAGIHYELWVETSAADDASAQMVLDAVLSAGDGNENSLIDAIRENNTLDGLVDDIVPTTSRIAQFGADGPIGAVVTVDVLIRKQGAEA